MKKQGFTLSELIIAITISMLILGGVVGFFTKLQNDIYLAKQGTQVYAGLTEFINSMNNFSKLYSSGSVVVGGANVFHAGLLMRPDKKSGILIGVVEQKTNNTSRLDPPLSKWTYGKKVIAYRKLNTSQINSIQSSSGVIYSMDFLDDGLFQDLTVTDFTITPNNSGALFEYKFNVETPFYEKLIGVTRNNTSENITNFSFTLDF